MFYVRLVQSRIELLPFYRCSEKESDYIGSRIEYQRDGYICADVQPLSDMATAEHYGIKIGRSVQLFAEPGTQAEERGRFEYRGETYEIKGVSTYRHVVKVVAEKI